MQFTYSKVPPICEADLSYSMYPASDTVYAESRKNASSNAVLVAPGIQEVYEPLGPGGHLRQGAIVVAGAAHGARISIRAG